MKSLVFAAIVLTGFVLFAHLAIAADRHVPSEYATIQAAIDASTNGDQIEVAAGTYNEAIDFNGKKVRLYSSGGATVTTINGTGHYHVVQCKSGEDANTTLEGFTIIGGHAYGTDQNDTGGGGMFNFQSSPTVKNCIFTGNDASTYGGGMWNYYSSPTVIDCNFIGNTSYYGGGMENQESGLTLTDSNFSNNTAYKGGGIYSNSYYNSSQNVTNCIFTGNSASYQGGGLYNDICNNFFVTNCIFTGNTATMRGGGLCNYSSSPTVTGCKFISNSAGEYGGGMCNVYKGSTVTDCAFINNTAGQGGGMCNSYAKSPSTTVTNCIFTGNSANGQGGGILNINASVWSVTNCTFTGNTAAYSVGGMYSSDVGSWSQPPLLNLTNCIFWNNTSPEIYIFNTTNVFVSYCDIKMASGTYPGTGNINADPRFVSGPDGNYYLSQIAAGQSVNSPCVDTGSQTSSHLGMDSKTTRTDLICDSGNVDMGYHYLSVVNPDLNHDAFIDFFDYALLANNWLISPDPNDPNSGDIIKDGQVNIYDLATLVRSWLNCFVTSATNPQPPDNATDISRNVVLMWSPGDKTVSHDVYFGTSLNEIYDANISSSQFMGNQDVNYWDINSYSPDGLDTNKTYYWRIDEAGPVCTAKGNVWNFTTVPLPPGQASNPSPANGTTSVGLTSDINWSAGSGAASHDVFFGTTNPPPPRGNQTGTTYDTGTMDTNTTYYWRIDEKNAGGTTTGDVWSFTTTVQLPGQAGNPIPGNGATGVNITADLSWTAGSLAKSHDVYFGTTNPPPPRGNQTGTTYDTEMMDTNTTYYWRIDEKNTSGTTEGTIWSFTTSSLPDVNDTNLVAWWKFDEPNGTIAHDSKGSNNGTVNGGAIWITGHIDGALSFDGIDDYVDCGTGPSNYDTITVSAWMQTSTNGVLVSNRYNSTGYGTWYTLSSTCLELGGNNSGSGYMNVTFNTPTLDGAWHHIVYTKSGTNHVLYVDGSLDQSFTSNADISWSQPLYIGKRWNRTSSQGWFNGIIDDVRIYNRALSADEVALLYQQ